jgi:hypothetical protein
MKEVLSLITFGIGALFFVVFFAAFRPDVVIAAPAPTKPGYCDTKAASTLACGSLILAAAMRPDRRQR